MREKSINEELVWLAKRNQAQIDEFDDLRCKLCM
jgi:hypothetical protein